MLRLEPASEEVDVDSRYPKNSRAVPSDGLPTFDMSKFPKAKIRKSQEEGRKLCESFISIKLCGGWDTAIGRGPRGRTRGGEDTTTSSPGRSKSIVGLHCIASAAVYPPSSRVQIFQKQAWSCSNASVCLCTVTGLRVGKCPHRRQLHKQARYSSRAWHCNAVDLLVASIR